MSQEYDVFADLNTNDNDDKAKFLETLKTLNVNTLNTGSSDEDDFLPQSLQIKGRSRGKRTKPPPAKSDKVPNGPKKTRKSDSQPSKILLQPVEPAPVANSRTTRSRSAIAPPATTSIVTTSSTTNAPIKGRKGRRRETRGGINEPDIVEPSDTMSLADSLGIMATMMRGHTRRNVMRARRNYFAEIAARSTNVDYVDLVSNPLPRIEGVISVDSDEEDNDVKVTSIETPNTSFVPALECSFDEDNPEVSVKIKWESGAPEIFKLRKYQKFLDIFSKIADRESTPIDNLVFNIDNRIIAPSDSPASINYKVYEFISGRALKQLFEGGASRKKRDTNVITLKIQSDLWPRKPLQVELGKTDKLKILYIKCAEELKKSAEDLVLSFNGDHLGFNDTPEDFEFEGDEAIDLRVKKL